MLGSVLRSQDCAESEALTSEGLMGQTDPIHLGGVVYSVDACDLAFTMSCDGQDVWAGFLGELPPLELVTLV